MEHTSKLLTLPESEAPDCWCTHSDDRHVVRWVPRQADLAGQRVEFPIAVVYCLECMERGLTANRLAVRQSLEVARSLLQARPELDIVVRILETHEKAFAMRDRGCSIDEIRPVLEEGGRLMSEAAERNLLQHLPDGRDH